MSIHFDDGTKADRALQLKEQGLSRVVIAERLGVHARNLNGMFQRAQQRRAQREVNKILERTAETAERVKG